MMENVNELEGIRMIREKTGVIFIKRIIFKKRKFTYTAMRIIKLKIFLVPVRLLSGYGKLIFVIISPFFAIFKNVVHRLEPGETPSYYAQRS